MAALSDVDREVSSDRGGQRRRRGPLSLDDCRCSVCLEIFIEPVTLPCTHTFCKVCFLESVDKSTLCCPLCRKRVSTWARAHSRTNSLVNQQLWTQIQTSFPQQCERRLIGQEDENDLGASVCFPTVSTPGELRQEYENEVTKLTEEKRAEEEEERKASEEYIQRLLAEEEALLQEENRRREEDERLARQLSSELNHAPAEDVLRSAEVSKRKKEMTCSGQIEKFLCPLPSRTKSDCNFMDNKENILLSGPLLPKLDHYRAPPPQDFLQDQDHLPASVEDHHIQRFHGGSSPTKRKCSELQEVEEAEAKRGCPSLPASSSSVDVEEWECEQLSRQRQEEEDRRLAMLLQKELDEEERRRSTDRRKGSADAYLLRCHQGEGEEADSHCRVRKTAKTASSSSTPKTHKTTKTTTSTCTSSSSTPSVRTSKTTSTSSSPSSSSSRRSKQTTLTEMFSFSS